jgi:hypothetical protein
MCEVGKIIEILTLKLQLNIPVNFILQDLSISQSINPWLVNHMFEPYKLGDKEKTVRRCK